MLADQAEGILVFGRRRELSTGLALAQALLAEAMSSAPVFDSPAAVTDFLKLHFAGQAYERFVVVFLDARHQLIVVEDVFRGTLTQTTHVFSYQGSRIMQVSTKAWYAALERVGIGDFRWHDLRHTWVSWHVQGGTPLYVLQEMGGWASAEMVRRYAHLAADHLAPYAERLGALRERRSAIHGTNPSQGPKRQEKST